MALKRILVGTEPIKQGLLQRFRNLSEEMRIVNGYGPTETTMCATLFPFCTAIEPDRRTPIGTGIRGYEVYLVDANMQLVPIGIPGELHIGGAGLAEDISTVQSSTPRSSFPIPSAIVRERVSTKPATWRVTCPMGTRNFLAVSINRSRSAVFALNLGKSKPCW